MRTIGSIAAALMTASLIGACGDADRDDNGSALVVVELPAASDVVSVQVDWNQSGCWGNADGTSLLDPGDPGCGIYPDRSDTINVVAGANRPDALATRVASRTVILPAGYYGTTWDVTYTARLQTGPDPSCQVATSNGVAIRPPGAGPTPVTAFINCTSNQQGSARVLVSVNATPVLNWLSYEGAGFQDGLIIEGLPIKINAAVIDDDARQASDPQRIDINFGTTDEASGIAVPYSEIGAAQQMEANWYATATFVPFDGDPDDDGAANFAIYGISARELDRNGTPIAGPVRVGDASIYPIWDMDRACWEPNLPDVNGAPTNVAGWGYVDWELAQVYYALPVDMNADSLAEPGSDTANKSLCPGTPPDCPAGCQPSTSGEFCETADGVVLGILQCPVFTSN